MQQAAAAPARRRTAHDDAQRQNRAHFSVHGGQPTNRLNIEVPSPRTTVHRFGSAWEPGELHGGGRLWRWRALRRWRWRACSLWGQGGGAWGRRAAGRPPCRYYMQRAAGESATRTARTPREARLILGRLLLQVPAGGMLVLAPPERMRLVRGMALANRPCMAQCDKNMQVCMGAPASVPGTGNPCLSSASCASSRRLPHLGLSRGRARPHVCVLLTLPRTLFISESLNIKLHAVDALGCMRGRVCANPRRRLPQGAKRVLLWHLRGVGLGQTRRMLVCRSRQLANLLRCAPCVLPLLPPRGGVAVFGVSGAANG